jgi:hypothetical protein
MQVVAVGFQGGELFFGELFFGEHMCVFCVVGAGLPVTSSSQADTPGPDIRSDNQAVTALCFAAVAVFLLLYRQCLTTVSLRESCPA